MFQCFHPSARLTQPTLTCQYLGTDGLGDSGEMDDEEAIPKSPGDQLKAIRDMYSRFRPQIGDLQRQTVRRRRAGDIPGSRTYLGNVQAHDQEQANGISSLATDGSSDSNTYVDIPTSSPALTIKELQPLISTLVHLDSSELFSQLCAQTIIAIPGTSSGFYRVPVEVSNGIIRVWRKWLAESNDPYTNAEPYRNTGNRDESTDKGEFKPTAEDSQQRGNQTELKKGILWVNDGQNVGIRFRVKERKWERDNPIPLSVDDDVPVSYELQYEGAYTFLQLRYISKLMSVQNFL